MSGVEPIQADIDRAAEYLAALLPEMPMLAERVKANGAGLARFFAVHRHEARAEALEEAAKVAASYSDGFALRPAEGWSELEKAGFETGVLDASLAIAAALRSGEREG